MPTVSTVSLHGMTGDMLAVTATPSTPGPFRIALGAGLGFHHPELRDRVNAAVLNSLPPAMRRSELQHTFTVDVRPPGTAAPGGAAVAVAVLAAAAGIPPATLSATAVLGDVGVDGSLRSTRGVLPAVQVARAHGVRRVIVPLNDLAEAALAEDVTVLGAHALSEIVDWLRGDDTVLTHPGPPAGPVHARQPSPMTALTPAAHRAVTIAAAGGHHLLADVGTDAGTLLIASWLHALLPDLTDEQQRELGAIQSLIGPREDGAVLVSTPPMVITHHSEPLVALLGGHTPGLMSRAHHGVLFAELDQFSAAAQNALRAVLIERAIQIDRAGRLHRYPAAFQLLATSIRTSRSRRWRLSLALRDAIDIQINADHTMINTDPQANDSARVVRLLARARAQVRAARARAADRWSLGPTVTNAVGPHEVLHALGGPAAVVDRVRRAQDAGGMSRRGGDSAVRLAWTLADLDRGDEPGRDHIDQALALRQGLDVGPERAGVR